MLYRVRYIDPGQDAEEEDGGVNGNSLPQLLRTKELARSLPCGISKSVFDLQRHLS